MSTLDELIETKAAKEHIKRFKELLPQMLTRQNDPIPLREEELKTTLEKKGEFELHLLTYADMQKELENPKLPHTVFQSLDIAASFEDDGRHTDLIEEFVKHIHSFLEKEQRFVFGIKRVEKTDKYPAKILFGEILPINQLQVTLGEEIYRFLDQDKEYHIRHFKEIRDAVSQTIGIKLLRLDPTPDPKLDPRTITITDPLTNKTLATFKMKKLEKKEDIELYYAKLLYILTEIAREFQRRHQAS